MQRILRLVTALAACAVCALSVGAAVSSARAAATPKTLTLYSVATEEQFLNHADDRARGKGNNPFGTFTYKQQSTQEAGKGPFPGDRAVFQFNLYTTASRTSSAGSATFQCQYDYNKTAYCDAAYILKGGDLIGGGELDFNAKTFALAIIGGTGDYRSDKGDVESGAVKKDAQRLSFILG